MKTITIEELEALKDAEKTIVDIRPQDQYMRGTFPGAVSLPASRLEEQYEEETARLDKMHPVYVPYRREEPGVGASSDRRRI
jgi:tRNA 2-thiocytidine biosynthesis protein TtcA